MSVWLTIPSARPVEEAERVLKLWRERGYKIALWRDAADGFEAWPDYCHVERYPGYALAVNRMISLARIVDPAAEWFVIGGDDIEPDPNHTAEEIAKQCAKYFGSFARNVEQYSTFGVMQPIGDRFAQGSIDRIAGSAWIGREFARRMYGGNGPLWHEHVHNFVDEELKLVAEKYGVYWMNPELIHLHCHFLRDSRDLKSTATRREPPPHLQKWCTKEHWDSAKAIFQKRHVEGFPGSEPIP